jgi:hypothetical protein
MPAGVNTQQNNKGCQGYDPWGRQFGNKYRNEVKLTPQHKAARRLWNIYLEKTEELRQCMIRGSVTEQQFNESTKCFRREYAESMYELTGILVRIE